MVEALIIYRVNCGGSVDFSRNVDVLVGTGPEQKSFTVHYDIVSRRTDYFKGVDLERADDLTEQQPDLFSQYLHCAYFDRIQDELAGEAVVARINGAADSYKGIVMLFKPLIKLYLLAAELENFIMTNLVIDKVTSLSDNLWKSDIDRLVGLAYKTGADPSWLISFERSLQKLLVNYYV